MSKTGIFRFEWRKPAGLTWHIGALLANKIGVL
jgi:hypothetical protein